jgi:hypothetical protein
MEELAKKIKEQRLIQATQKGLTGLDGKIGTIVKNMGEPIINHTGGSLECFAMESSFLEDPYELEDDEEMPIYDEDQPRRIGMFFDGLSRGMHIEIKYLADINELTVNYKGYLVYAEEVGELVCYVPSPEWESKIEQLFLIARKKEAIHRKEDIQEQKEEAMREKLSFLEKIKLRWGTS